MEQVLYRNLDMPIEYYAASLLLMLVTGCICFYQKRDICISVAWAFLIGYIFLILASTVITRTVEQEYDFKWELFWSYAAIKKGRKHLLYLNIANVLMLIPVGFLLSCVSVMSFKKAILSGILISGGIEVAQLSLKRGLFEFDDVFHNTLGCVIGYLIYRLYKCIRKNTCR